MAALTSFSAKAAGLLPANPRPKRKLNEWRVLGIHPKDLNDRLWVAPAVVAIGAFDCGPSVLRATLQIGT